MQFVATCKIHYLDTISAVQFDINPKFQYNNKLQVSSQEAGVLLLISQVVYYVWYTIFRLYSLIFRLSRPSMSAKLKFQLINKTILVFSE